MVVRDDGYFLDYSFFLQRVVVVCFHYNTSRPTQHIDVVGQMIYNNSSMVIHTGRREEVTRGKKRAVRPATEK